uniref:SAP domain-containing protein n=1 Tax=Lotharella globosa TaxID=91324 RepID=A0A7S3Z964_9EUKA
MTTDDELDVDKLRVVDLQKELRKRSLDTKGRKAELVSRLKAYIAKKKQEKPDDDKPDEKPKPEPETKAIEEKGQEHKPPQPERTRSSVLDLVEEDDDDDADEKNELEVEANEPEADSEKDLNKKSTKEKPGSEPMQDEDVKQKKSMEKPRKRSAGSALFGNALRAATSDLKAAKPKRRRLESERGAPRKVLSIKKKRINVRTEPPRKGRFEQISYKELHKEASKRIEFPDLEKITIEIENDEADAPVVENDGDMVALRIDGFVRPFRVSQVQELLENYGHVTHMWMDSIKTHCYATYKDPAEAQTAYKAIHNLRWPDHSPKKLRVRYVQEDEAIEAARPKLAAREEPKRKSEKKAQLKALDELFKRTKAKPMLYWKPLTDEEVQEKEERRKRLRNGRF